MTHAEATSGASLAQLATDCDGPLQLIESHPDRRIGAWRRV